MGTSGANGNTNNPGGGGGRRRRLAQSVGNGNSAGSGALNGRVVTTKRDRPSLLLLRRLSGCALSHRNGIAGTSGGNGNTNGGSTSPPGGSNSAGSGAVNGCVGWLQTTDTHEHRCL